MALALSEDHAQLADSVRSWAARTCPSSAVRTAADGDDSGAAFYRDTIRPGLAELGLLGLHLPEADGGQGAGLTVEREPGDRSAKAASSAGGSGPATTDEQAALVSPFDGAGLDDAS